MRRTHLLSTSLVVTGLITAVVIFGGENSWGRFRWNDPTSRAVEIDDPSITLRAVRDFPESVNAILPHPDRMGSLYVGTSPTGAVHSFNMSVPIGELVVGNGLGDQLNHGTCNVNRLAFEDLDGDGVREILASTSQILPRGRPRLYAWSAHPGVPILAGMARPDIDSSWSHGLAFLPRPDGTTSAFITFCGYGEIVEYRLTSAKDSQGFHASSLSAKKVGQLPASGEWIQSCDADNDGSPELVLATGYAVGKAAVEFRKSDAPGAETQVVRRIDEGGRFGNVRFHVADDDGDGRNELFAWWCTDIDGGRCEVIRYEIDTTGVTERTVLAVGPAGLLWADDAQAAVVDLNRNGRPELWFATRSGHLYRHEAGAKSLAHVAYAQGGFGPLTIGPKLIPARPVLLVASGNQVMVVEQTPLQN